MDVGEVADYDVDDVIDQTSHADEALQTASEVCDDAAAAEGSARMADKV